MDGDGDGLQPLPQMTRPSMQRSFSSHALGTLRNLAPAPPSKENSFSSRHSQVDHSGGLTSPGTRMQPHLSDFQTMGGMRPLMRRVHSAGDIQVTCKIHVEICLRMFDVARYDAMYGRD